MHPVLALFRRNAWATERLLNWCEWQPAVAAPAEADVYGDIGSLFNHILGAENRYLRALTGESPDDAVVETSPRSLPDLRQPARRLADRWEAVLEGDRDIEAVRQHQRQDRRFEMPDWLPLVQAVHHGDDHRAQIGTLLGRSSVITPELDGWFFGFEPASPGTAPSWADALLVRSFGHHLWATQQLLDACRTLTPEQLDASAPGTYGSIRATLTHLVSSEWSYLSRLKRAGRQPRLEDATPVETLLELWDRQRLDWLDHLGSVPDHEATVETGDGWYPGWVLVLQAIHHGNEHRTNVGTVMLSQGIELPGVDVWSYAIAEGVLRTLTPG